MDTKKIMLAGLMMPFIFTGCLIAPPRPEAHVRIPVLPPLVVLGAEPYYEYSGYHYYYRDNRWRYSHAKGGPLYDLPRDHYPKEIRYKDSGHGRDTGHGRENDRGHGSKGR